MRVLVVEDQATLAEGLRLGLEAEGIAVDVAPTGTDGIRRARSMIGSGQRRPRESTSITSPPPSGSRPPRPAAPPAGS